MQSKLAVLLGGLGLASAAPRHSAPKAPVSLSKKWYYDVCANDCTLSGVPMPDVNTLQLPLENNAAQQCPPIAITKADGSTVTSQVCLDFVGTNLYFNFSSFSGYTTTAATVTWKLKGNVDDSSSQTSPPPTTDISCSNGNSGYTCKLPFSTILNKQSYSTIPDLMAGMCPNGDREALDFYLQFSGKAQYTDSNGAVSTVSFKNLPPCTSRDSNNKCTTYSTSISYFEMTYRCSKCETAPCPSSSSSTYIASTTSSSTSTSVRSSTVSTTSSRATTSASSTMSTTTTTSKTSTAAPPPSTKTCTYGTAFGYEKPSNGQANSYPLSSCSSGANCNRWGWYETPTLSELQKGVTGPLYVGAGGNDVNKAVQVGTWTATADSKGSVSVSYMVQGSSSSSTSYGLSEVRVQLSCLPLNQCSPSQYTYSSGALNSVSSFTASPIAWPKCGSSGGPSGPGNGPSGPGNGPSGPGNGPSGPNNGPSGPGNGPSGPGNGPSGPGNGPSGPSNGNYPSNGPSGPGNGPSGPGNGPSGPGNGPSGPSNGNYPSNGPSGPGNGPSGPGNGPSGPGNGPSGPGNGPSGPSNGNYPSNGPSGPGNGPSGPGNGPSGPGNGPSGGSGNYPSNGSGGSYPTYGSYRRTTSTTDSQVALIVYAVVNILTTSPGTCPAPVCN